MKKQAAGVREQVLKSVGRGGSSASFFDVVVRDRAAGVGKKFRRNRDADERTFFEPVQVSTYFTPSGKARGQAYGYYTFRGVREDVVRPLRSGHKKEWREFVEDEVPVKKD